MRLTPEVVASAPQYTGPNRARVLSLRELRLPAVENLAAAGDFFDAIDLSANDLIRLGGFPPSKRLETLVAANNRISRIDDDFAVGLTALKNLVLTNNKLQRLADIAPLRNCESKLTHLSLLGNPVADVPEYRPFVIHMLPSVRFLDFAHVSQKEREDAGRLFGGDEGAARFARLAARNDAMTDG